MSQKVTFEIKEGKSGFNVKGSLGKWFLKADTPYSSKASARRAIVNVASKLGVNYEIAENQ